jgi:predicted DNA-binding transcriptional regulator AlpA
MKQTMDDNQELLKASEVKSMLKISTSALWNYVNEGLIKSYRIGNTTIRFKKNEILEIIKPNIK